jgi:hypothetical protein
MVTTCNLGAEAPKYPSRPTHASLSKALTADKKKEKKFTPSKSNHKKFGSKELAALYTKLNARGMWVGLPKGSIIYTPPGLKNHISEKAVGKYSDWKKFLQQNRSIIYDFPVTLSQAYGKEVLEKSQIEAYKKYNKIVIATYKGSPTGVSKNAFKPKE